MKGSRARTHTHTPSRNSSTPPPPKRQSIRLARCGVGGNDLYQLLEAVHAASLLPIPPSSSSSSFSSSSHNKGGKTGRGMAAKMVGLRGLSLEGNPALGAFGVQVRLAYGGCVC
jgi:hypothetical protein